jgi:hypothetical protein
MKKTFVIAILTMFILACGLPALSTTQSPVPPTTAPNTGGATAQPQNQMATFVAQTVEAQPPAATQPAATQAPTATTAPQATQSAPIGIAVNQNWSGTFLWNGYSNVVNLIIQKINGSSFTGAQAWSATQCRVTERTQGDIIQDVTTATEQNRWALHPDYQSGDKSGTWLRWTETESIGSGRCYLTISGDWYYAHVKSNGHLIAIHFTNSTNTQPDRNAILDLTLYSQ